MTERFDKKLWINTVRDSRVFRWCIGVSAVIALLLFVVSFLLDEPLRRKMEANMNRDLKGYTVQIPRLHIQLLDLSLTLKDMSVVQQAHPEFPVIVFPVLKASIHWSAIYSGKLVAEFKLYRPKININLLQLRSEVAKTSTLKERGWQQAVEEIYPLKINTLKIIDANITYIDKDPKKPLTLSHLNLQAQNIRNIRLPDKVYPSSFHVDTAIFDTGYGALDGNANFLALPLPAFKGRVKLEKVPIDHFSTLTADSNVTLHGGNFSASGNAEYAPTVKLAHLEKMLIKGMSIEYVHSQRTAVAEKKRAVQVGKVLKKLNNKQDIMIRADQVNLTDCTIAMVNKAVKKPYRLFLAGTNLQMSNFSSRFSQGPAKMALKAKFMGSGDTTATATFRPENAGADFDLHVKMEETQLTLLNDVLLSYGDFDVSAGVFALVTELHIKDNKISGYVKPFFKDMKVYDRRKDNKRGITHQMYEMMVGAAATILENRPHQEVATRIDISGSLKHPETSTFQIVIEFLKNGFFKALLPGFEKGISRPGKK